MKPAEGVRRLLAGVWLSRLAASRGATLSLAGLLVVMIGILDWRIAPNVSLGLLYVFPILLAAEEMRRWEILAMAGVCAVLREAFSPFRLDVEAVPRFLMVLLAFGGTGLFFGELARSRRSAVKHLRELRSQIEQRQEAEEQLELLIESSPAAIVTADAEGKIVLANSAAQQLFGFDEQGWQGERLERYLSLPKGAEAGRGGGQVWHRMVECAGRRRDRSGFLAQVWLSSYATGSGLRTAAIVWDASEQLRDRAEWGLQQLSVAAHTAMGAVWHEVRNLCAAVSTVHTNLKRVPGLWRNEDFEALGTLVEGLQRMASRELSPGPQQTPEAVDLLGVLNQVRLIVEPSFERLGAALHWEIPDQVAPVLADREGLLHVFLNLARNATRALERAQRKELAVEVRSEGTRVAVRFRDSGPGVARLERLFRPFQPEAEATGLGLFVSRAILRSFGGDLRYEPQRQGGCFRVELETVQAGGASA